LDFARGTVWDKFKHMALSPELLEILRCPKCKSEVELKADGKGLKCVNPECALVYPIRDDIPVMLIDEAATESRTGQH
jgi:uncharacterized protein YbaR (Trm112 family)